MNNCNYNRNNYINQDRLCQQNCNNGKQYINGLAQQLLDKASDGEYAVKKTITIITFDDITTPIKKLNDDNPYGLADFEYLLGAKKGYLIYEFNNPSLLNNPISYMILEKISVKYSINGEIQIVFGGSNFSGQYLNVYLNKTIKETPLSKEFIINVDAIINANIENLTNRVISLENNKLDKSIANGVVYTNDEDGNPDYIPYSVEPTPKQKSVVIRSDEGRAQFEDPEGEKDAVNKRTYDKVVRATTYNHAGLLFVSPLNETTGKITVIYNSSLVREITNVNTTTGTIKIFARPINWECKPKEGN